MPFPTIHTIFDEVSFTATRRGVCPVCGKSGKRQTRLSQTLSPYNRNVRTYTEVQLAVLRKVAAWQAVPFVHQRCEGKS